MKIMLDPGHYGTKYNHSPVVNEYYESVMNWKLTGYLKAELTKRGVEVGVTRTDINKDLELYTRGYKAKGYDMFISIHSNACGTESVDYPIVYRGYDKTEENDFALKLAQLIHNTMGTKQDGRTGTRKGNNGEYYGVLRGARAAGLNHYYIVEHSFHTNTASAKWLLDDNNLKKLAEAEAEFICSYFKVNAPVPTPEQVNTHIVQKGESLYVIAKKYNMTLLDLIKANPQITDVNKIYVGQRINVKGEAQQVFHTVKKGDTMYKIAKAYGITLAALIKLNPQLGNPAVISVGQQIRVK